MPPSAFEQKLAEAQSGQAKKRKRILTFGALAVVVALAVGGFYYLAVQLERARAQLQQVEQSGLSSSPSSPSPPTAAADPNTAAPPPSEEAVAPPDEVAVAPNADIDALREQFIAQLAQYEDEVEPRIDAINLGDWDADKYTELTALKSRAIDAFAAGDHSAAREGLRRARELSAGAEADHADRLAAAKRAALDAFAADRADETQRAIQQALQFAPADADMLALAKRVAVLRETLDFLHQAEVARTENRPAKEAEALRRAVALDPARSAAQVRLKAVQAQIQQQRFAEAVEAARDALAAEDLSAAQQHIESAAGVFPAHEALTPLREQLKQSLTAREYTRQMTLGEQSVAGDDWQTALTHFARAQMLKPNEQTASSAHALAQRVVGAMRDIEQMLAREERLADANIIDSARAYLSQTEAVTAQSASLRERHRELARVVELYATEVEVVVLSDNATHIIVRGEGHVGKTTRRTIRLRPGKRVFEGSRSGYQSKLVTLNIAPRAQPVALTVRVVCDEKI